MHQEESIIQETYENFGSLEIKRYSVNDNLYKELADLIYSKRDFQLSNLTNSGRAFFQLCKNILFLGRTEPISPNSFSELNERSKRLFDRLNDYERKNLKDLFNHLSNVFGITKHHFIDELVSLTSTYQNVCIVHQNEIYNSLIEEIFLEHGIDSYLKADQSFEYRRFFDLVIVLGKPEWYKESIAFPPTKDVICMMYNWDFTNFELLDLFSEIPSLRGDKPVFKNDLPRKVIEEESQYTSIIDNTIDRELIKSKLYELEKNSERKGKIGSVLLTLLDDQYAVLIPDTSNYEISVLKQDNQGGGYKLVELSPSYIRNGMWYLDRGFSSEDLKKKLSRKQFGDKYINSVKDQKRWKDLLTEKINRMGINRVVKELRSRGSNNARDYNVRNWASYNVIRPDSDHDLKTILDFIHIGDEFEIIATSAEVIRKCHKKVGFQITDLLMEEIEKELEQGEIKLIDASSPIEVYLEEDDKTKMTLYPITSKHQYGEIDRSLTHQIFKYI